MCNVRLLLHVDARRPWEIKAARILSPGKVGPVVRAVLFGAGRRRKAQQTSVHELLTIVGHG